MSFHTPPPTEYPDVIVNNPEYRRVYQHYIDNGTSSPDAHGFAYRHTINFVAQRDREQRGERKRKNGLVLVLVIAGVIALCTIMGIVGMLLPDSTDTIDPVAGDATASASATSAAPTPSASKPVSSPSPTPAAAKIGTPVRDGNFEFVVVKVEYGKTEVGNGFQKAQGQYALVTLKVTNVKNDPQLFAGTNQKAFIGSAKYEADTTAAIYANQDAYGDSTKSFLNDINPGNSVEGIVVFDIPAGKKLTKVELHDSAFSGGVEVTLS